MTVSASQLLPFIVLLPLLGAFLNGVFGRRFNKTAIFGIGVGSVAIAFILSLRAYFALEQVAVEQPLDPALRETVWTWAATGLFQFDVAFYLDPLSAVMLLIVTGVGLLIHLYSTGYMADDPSVHRYFSYLNLFMFSMLVLILGKNLFMLFVGWEGVGVCSYLLIGFWFTDDQKAQAGQKAFVVNRIGDFGFLVGLGLLIYHARGTTDYDVLKWLFTQGQNGPFYDQFTLVMTCVLLFVGAAGKSAQIPLYVWLPDAMAGPTPVSALIHAATMVTAGVYMMTRLSFMYTLAPLAMDIIAVVGALTALAAALMALTQRDIKKVLAYSTVSQLGYMVLAVGVGAFFAGIFHLMTHAFFKALLFLGSGAVIHAMHHEQDIFKMGGLKKKLPITRWTFLIGTLAIAGVPFLSGFYSKDAILWEVRTTQRLLSVPDRAVAVYEDASFGFIGGRDGVVLRREGDAWQSDLVPPVKVSARGTSHLRYPDVRSITAVGDSFWAVGGDVSTGTGAVYRGRGRGWTLEHQVSEKGAPLNAVWGSGPEDVWAVGDRGLVVHYNGKEWTRVEVPTVMSLTAITGTSATDVIAGGGGGTLLRWDGKAWAVESGIGTGTIVSLMNAGGTLVGATERGDLMKRGAAGWEKAVAKAPGVQSLAIRSVALDDQGKLWLAGRGSLQGADQTIAVALHGAWGGDFQLHTGPPGILFTGVVAGASGPTLTADNRQIYRLETQGETTAFVPRSGVPSKPWFHQLLWILATISAGLTAFYMFRLYFITFEGETRADPEVWAHCHENPPNMTIPLIILAVLSVVGGWWGSDLQAWFGPVLATADARLQAEPHHTLMAYVPTAVGILGIGLAFAFYGRVSTRPAELAASFPRLYALLNNKFYVDELYHLIVVTPFRWVARLLHEVIDRLAVDGLLVHGSASIWKVLGRALRPLHAGNVQNYAVAVAVGLAVLIWLVGMKPTLW